MYNTRKVKPAELSTYEALGDPKWKGRLRLRTSGGGHAAHGPHGVQVMIVYPLARSLGDSNRDLLEDILEAEESTPTGSRRR